MSAKKKTIPEAELAVEKAVDTTKSTGKGAGDRVREIAQFGVMRATEGYEQISKAAQTATEELNTQFTEAREGAAKAGLKLLDVAKEDSDATYAVMRDLMTVKSPIEAFDIAAKYWRGRIETRIATVQDLGAYVRKAADDAARPVRERIEKFTKVAA